MIHIASKDTSYPLSYAQRRMWTLQKIGGSAAAYNDPSVLRINGELRVEVLKKALQIIVERHHILAMRFSQVDGEPVQALYPYSIEIPVVPIQNNPETVEEEITRFICTQTNKPFHLAEDPLLRVILGRIHEREYVLILNAPHIIIDGWSKGILLSELQVIYRGLIERSTFTLPDLPIQYPDYALWQRGQIESGMYNGQEEYWQRKLEGIPPLLDLAIDRVRPATPSGRGALFAFSVPPSLASALQKLAIAERITPFMLYLALFQILLFRYTGVEDMLVASPISNRDRLDAENLIGLFLNLLLLRLPLKGEKTVREVFSLVKQATLEAFAHKEIPYEQVVKRLNPLRDGSFNPVYQVLFQYQNAPIPSMDLPGIHIAPLQIDTGFSHVDLSLTLFEEGGLQGFFEYNTDILSKETISDMVNHLLNLMEAATKDPSCPIAYLEMFSSREYRELRCLRGVEVDLDEGTTINTLFKQTAARYLERPAVLYREDVLTYRELNQRSVSLCSALRQEGVGVESLVLIAVSDPPTLISAVMAVLCCGAAFTIVEPDLPAERIAFYVEDARPVALIIDREQEEKFSSFNKILFYSDALFAANGEIDSSNEIHISSRNAGCVIFTSGSRGRPNGVILEHRGIINLIHSFIQSYELTCKDVMLPITSVASASFVGEILPLLCTGGAVVLDDPLNYLDLSRVIELIKGKRVTLMSTVPSFAARLNEVDFSCDHLRYILCGGESLKPGDIDKLRTRYSIVNGYGLTEGTICSTYCVLPKYTEPGELSSIGKPIGNTRIYITDCRGNPLPFGCVGDIHISGEGLARGYLNNDELTKLRFTPPWERKQLFPKRLLNTKDRGKLLRNGNLIMIGRADDQVQINGHRVEPGEIECVLSNYPGVRHNCVILDSMNKNNRLVAYIEGDGRAELSSSHIKRYLEKHLPFYMVPSIILIIPVLPLSINGKVDIQRLPPVQTVREAEWGEYVAPSTAIEKKITPIWRHLLGVEKIGVNDQFFNLGGDSLLMVRLHEELMKVFPERKLSVVDLFRSPTIAAIAALLTGEEEKMETAESRQRKMLKFRTNLDRFSQKYRRKTEEKI